MTFISLLDVTFGALDNDLLMDIRRLFKGGKPAADRQMVDRDYGAEYGTSPSRELPSRIASHTRTHRERVTAERSRLAAGISADHGQPSSSTERMSANRARSAIVFEGPLEPTHVASHKRLLGGP